MQPIIFHLDMNSYFATAEQQDNPEWRGKPLGVCEHLGGIIIAASIEAKKWGIKTGTPVWEARKLYPKIILTHTRAEAYRNYNRKLVKLVSDYVSEVEVASIDEVYLDMTKSCNVKGLRAKGIGLRAKGIGLSDYYQVNPFEEAVRIAQEIKQRMKTEVGDYLTCSIGIADNKLLAKIGSDLKKPDGIVVITINQNAKIKMQNLGVSSFAKNELYNQLKLIDIPGIGRRMEKRLNALGIRSLIDLKNYPQTLLVSAFGINGHHLYNMGQLASLENNSLRNLWTGAGKSEGPFNNESASFLTGLNGSWKSVVHQEREIKSIGHMYTLPKEYREQKFFAPVLYKLCEMVGRRLRNKNLSGNIIYFYLRDKNNEGCGESRRLGFYISDGRDIFMQCMKIYERLKTGSLEFKLIGVTVAGLLPTSHQQSLFKDDAKKDQVVKALDAINKKYGDFTVCRAPILAAGKVFHDSVGFGRVKEI